MIFATATAGNHGIGIAWAAREMGQKAFIYMPKGSSAISVSRVEKLGAIGLGLLYQLCKLSSDGGNPSNQDTAYELVHNELAPDELGPEIRKKLGLDQDSVVMIFSTEGDTNPDLYRDIVWNGGLPLQL